MLKLSPETLYVIVSAFSDSVFIFDIRHDPETACDPAGPLATRVSSPLPVTGSALVALLSVNSNINMFPSGETHVLEVPTVLPFFFVVSSIVRSSTTLTLIVSKYGCPVTFWSWPSALMSMGGTQVLQWYMPSCNT